MKIFIRSLMILLVLSLLMGFAPKTVQAVVIPPPQKCPDFVLTATHGIDGTRIGLSKELPVIIEVYLYGKPLTQIPLKFQENYMATLLRGDYSFKVFSTELQAYIPTAEVATFTVKGCTKVGLHIRLVDGVPVTKVIVKNLYPSVQ
ncbi:MAG: hypothetical protein ACYDH1_02480 [Anaerolineaceae bacterium]